MAMPRSLSRRITRNSVSTSRASSDDVGSSMITTRASICTARAIATICCAPRPNERSGRDTFTSMPKSRRMLRASRFIRRESIRPLRRGSRLRNRLRATLISGTRLISW